MIKKKEFIDMVAEKSGATKKESAEWVEIILDTIKDCLELYGGVKLVHFGVFSVRKRQSRLGRNPNTDERLHIGERNVAHFAPGKEIKELINQ